MSDSINKNKTYLKWFALCSDVVWTESDIIYFRKAIGMSGLKDDRLRSALYRTFIDRMPEGGYRLTREQQSKGTQYLLSKSLKQNGERRKGCILGTHEIGILLDPSVQHTLTHLAPQYNGLDEVLAYMAVYRASARGRWFEYLGTSYEQSEVTAIGKSEVA